MKKIFLSWLSLTFTCTIKSKGHHFRKQWYWSNQKMSTFSITDIFSAKIAERCDWCWPWMLDSLFDLNPCESEWKSNQKIFVFYPLSVDPRSGNSATEVRLRDHRYITSAKRLGGWVQRGHFCWPINPKQFWTCPNFFRPVQN